MPFSRLRVYFGVRLRRVDDMYPTARQIFFEFHVPPLESVHLFRPEAGHAHQIDQGREPWLHRVMQRLEFLHGHVNVFDFGARLLNRYEHWGSLEQRGPRFVQRGFAGMSEDGTEQFPHLAFDRLSFPVRPHLHGIGLRLYILRRDAYHGLVAQRGDEMVAKILLVLFPVEASIGSPLFL